MGGIVITLLIVLIAVVIFSLVVVFAQQRQITYYKVVSKNIASMNIVQNMLEIMSSKISAEDKIKELNNIIINTYGAKYSSIVIYDGNSYEIKATNVENIYNDSIRNLSEENDFKANIAKNVSKYLTTSATKTLTYKSAIERKIRSAMFSPIYSNGVYIGFWILEDGIENAFDSISKDDLSKLKANLGVFIDTVQFQNAIEKAENTDKQTGFYNSLYLYSSARLILSKNENNALSLICIKNIPEINEKYGRNIGDTLIVKIANLLKETLSKDAIFIRYSGVRVLIVFPNTTAESMQPTIERLLTRLREEFEYYGDEKISVDIQIVLHTYKNQNNMDTEMNRMTNFIEKMQDVNNIKII